MFKKIIFGLSLLFFSFIAMAKPLNINTATAEEIATTMKGVGSSKSKAIIEFREKHGKFERLDEIMRVKGIGFATLDKNREKITVK